MPYTAKCFYSELNLFYNRDLWQDPYHWEHLEVFRFLGS